MKAYMFNIGKHVTTTTITMAISGRLDTILMRLRLILTPILDCSCYLHIHGRHISMQGSPAVKIYLFNPETGVYLGEDFADEAPMERGRYVVPPDATTIAPPLTKRGQVPIFNVAEQSWTLRQTDEMRGE